MKTAIRCGKCRNMYMEGEQDCTLILDFYEQKFEFFCPSCKKDNVMSFETWKKKQEHSPLPLIKTM